MGRRTAEIQRAVGALIKRRRAAIGVSQETLAAAVGLSRSSIANIESGRQKIGVSLLYIVADALQTTPHELMPPPERKSAAKREEVSLPSDLPREEQAWIRKVLNPAKKRAAR